MPCDQERRNTMFFAVIAIFLVALLIDQIIQFIAAHHKFVSQLTEKLEPKEDL
jgi:hypothetical protein